MVDRSLYRAEMVKQEEAQGTHLQNSKNRHGFRADETMAFIKLLARLKEEVGEDPARCGWKLGFSLTMAHGIGC